MTAPAPEGLDVPAVTAWYAEHVPGAQPPLEFELVAGGRSNLTYRVVDAAGTATALRRPPTSHVLKSAHDMGREHRLITALAPAGVPVAPALGYCADPSVTGAPFYVMEFVQGHILRTEEKAQQLPVGARRRASEDLVDVLAHLHAVDVDEVGLGDLGRKEGYIARQLKRWYGQVQQSTAETGRQVPLVHEVHERLVRQIPDQGKATVVHGDYRLDNCVLADDGTVKAVLDWELCTLGDPLADVGLLAVYWTDPDDPHSALGVSPTRADGFLRRRQLLARYAERTGRDVDSIDFYVAFGYWKLACILEGVLTRYAGGAAAGDRSDVDSFAGQIDLLAMAADQASAKLA